jgi:hypothetical protein
LLHNCKRLNQPKDRFNVERDHDDAPTQRLLRDQLPAGTHLRDLWVVAPFSELTIFLLCPSFTKPS